MSFPELRSVVARGIFECGAFKDKSRSENGQGFRLKLHEKHPDAPLSPYYLNLRTPDNPKPGPLTPKLVSDIGLLLYRHAVVWGIKFHRIAGIPRAGDPLAAAFAEASSRPDLLIKLGKADASEGKGRQVVGIVAGSFSEGDAVLFIDDLITGADTKLEAVDALKEGGLAVKDILVLLDREQGGAEALANFGYQLHAVFTVSWLLNFYLAEGLIDQAVFGEIASYRRGPKFAKA